MKNVFLLLFTLIFIFNSCSSDEDNNSITVKTSEISLTFGKKYQIEASSESAITYTSENEYYATVSQTGLVTAGRFGETIIVLNDGNSTQKVRVKIAKSSDLYPDPIIEWGISRSEIIKRLGIPDTETDSGIGYSDYSSTAPMVIYLFDDNNKLNYSSVMVKTAYSSQLGIHLGERYMPVASQDYTTFFINSVSINTASMAVAAEIYNINYWSVLYYPYSNSQKSIDTSGKDESRINAINELMAQLTK